MNWIKCSDEMPIGNEHYEILVLVQGRIYIASVLGAMAYIRVEAPLREIQLNCYELACVMGLLKHTNKWHMPLHWPDPTHWAKLELPND